MKRYDGYEPVEEFQRDLPVYLMDLGDAMFNISFHRRNDGGNLLYVMFVLKTIEIETTDLNGNSDVHYQTDFKYFDRKAICDHLAQTMIESRNWNPALDNPWKDRFEKMLKVGRGFVFTHDDVPTELLSHTHPFFNF